MYCFSLLYFAHKSLSIRTNNELLALYFSISFDFLLDVTLFILFIHKIKNKNSMEGMEIADDLSSIDYHGRMDYNSDKTAIWNIMIKHCVLFGIALLSDQAFYISMIIDDLESIVVLNLFRDYGIRCIENVLNIVVLWLVLKVNNDRYVQICKCWHKCILKYCMKEDPNMIREGFSIDNGRSMDNPRMTLSALLGPLLEAKDSYDSEDDKIEGHDLIVTQENDGMDDNAPMLERVDSKVEGHNVLMTQLCIM